MSQTRVFGAIKGVGTQVVRKAAARPIEQGPYGGAVILGIFRSGPTDKVISLESGLSQYRRIYGGLTTSSQAPLCCEHYYSAGEGAGELHILRVTDGTDVKASRPLRGRKVDTSVVEQAPHIVYADLGTISAHNGGRWGGRRAVMAGDIGAGAVTSTTTVNLGFTTKANAWVGAMLKFPQDVPAAAYRVISNTAQGVFTIDGTFDSSLSNPSDGRWNMELVNTNEITGMAEALEVEISDGGENPNSYFSFYPYRDGDAPRSGWENLALDSSGKRYWKSSIEDDTDNYEISVTDSYVGDPADMLARPANFAEIPAPNGMISTNQVKFQVLRWTRTGTGTPYVDTVNDVTWGSDPRPCLITLTFTNSTTFTVSAVMEEGGYSVVGLPNGTLGMAYAAQHPWLPGFTARAGGVNAVSGDKLFIYARPLPTNLHQSKGGAYYYPAAASSEGNVRNRYLIVGNTYDTITLQTGINLTGLVVPPSAPTRLGSIAGPWTLSNGQTLIFTAQGRSPITLTSTLTSSQTAQQLADHLNGLELTRVSGVASDVVVVFTAESNKLRISSAQDFGNTATLTIGNGTLNAVVGFTNAEALIGVAGKIGRIQYRQALAGGYDGIAGVAASTYVAKLDSNTSLINNILPYPTGMLKLAMPGVTDATAQAQLMQYAFQKGMMAYTEIPSGTTTESGAIAWHETNLKIGEAQDAHAIHWPSYGYITNPYGTGLYLASLTGLIMGKEAALAVVNKGVHLAPAGPDYTLSPTVKSLPTGKTVLNNEALNSYGLIEIRARGSVITVRGDRIPGYQGRLWKHKELAIGHVVQTLLTGLDQLEFRPINDGTFAQSRYLLRTLFQDWFVAGWFDDSEGPTFDKQVSIKVDSSNNPVSEREKGNMHIDIAFDIVNTAERVIVSVGSKGVAVQGAA